MISYVVFALWRIRSFESRFEAKTLVLWGMPAILLVAGIVTLVLAARRRAARIPGAPLSAEEKEALDKLLRP